MKKVPGFGNKNAKIVLVGESPGREELIYGRPFVGSAGKLLNKMLANVGIDRKECYLTNVMKVRPPGDDFGVFYEEEYTKMGSVKKRKARTTPSQILQEGIATLIEEIKAIKPNVTVALGTEPLKALAGRIGITKWRGSILDSSVGKVIGTFHPSGILRQYKNRVIAELDLRRVVKESVYTDLSLPVYKFTIDPTFEEVMTWLGEVNWKTAGRISFDIETTQGIIRCIGLSRFQRSAICIPFMSNKNGLKPGSTLIQLDTSSGGKAFNNHWTLEEEMAILEELNRILSDERIKKIAQNFPYDSTKLMEQFGIVVKGLWMDTMVAQHCCYSELPKSLDFLCSVYTRCPRYSDHDASVDREEWTYNCYDAAVTFEVSLKLEKEMEELGVN